VPEPTPKTPAKPRPRRGRRRWLVLLLLLLAGAWWLNGPGVRWIGGIALHNALENAGLTGDFRIGGSITGGLSLHDVRLHGTGAIQQLCAAEIHPTYRLTELTKGKLRGLNARSLSLVVELESGPPAEDESPPLDWQQLPSQLRSAMAAAHRHAASLDILLDDFDLELRRSGTPVFQLAPSRISHRSPAAPVELSLGTITDASGRRIEPQVFEIDWQPDRIEIAPFSPLADWKIDGLALDTRGAEHPLLAADAVVKDRRLSLSVSSDLHTGTLNFRGEPLAWSDVAPGFGLKTDFDFEIRKLELEFANLGESPADWMIQSSIDLQQFHWREWRADSFTLELTKRDRTATGNWSLSALGAHATGKLSGTWPDPQPILEEPVPAPIKGDLEISGLPALLDQLSPRFEIPRTGTPFPGQSLTADWQLDFDGNLPKSAHATAMISPPADSATPSVDLTAAWQAGTSFTASLDAAGVHLEGSLDETWEIYSASLDLEAGATATLRPWADPFFDELPDQLAATGNATGKGCFDPPHHEGSIRLDSFTWKPAGSDPVQATARADYRYPDLKLAIQSLHASHGDYIADLRANLENQKLTIHQLDARHGDEPLFSLEATTSVPGNPADWQALLKLDDPWKIDLTAESFDLSRLAKLLPEENLPPLTGSADATLAIAGSPSSPTVSGKITLAKAGAADSESLPPADLTLDLETHAGELSADGILQLPGLPAISLTAGIPLRPAEWLDDPDFQDSLPLRGRAEIPAIDLSKLPQIATDKGSIAGTFNATIDLAGTPKKPTFTGSAALRQFEFIPADERIAAVQNGSVELKLDGDRIYLTRLECDSAGGKLNGAGSLDISEIKNPRFDLRIKGGELPAWRSDSTIVRVNPTLRLTGTPADATISGQIDVVQSLFFRDFEIIPIGIPFTTPSAPKLPTIDPAVQKVTGSRLPDPFKNWNLDVTVSTRDPFLIRGNLAQGSITADVRIGGTLGQPSPSGALDVRNFEAELPLSRLRITSGRATFRPDAPFEPKLEIRGRSVLRPYDVNIFVSGTPGKPLVTLTSNPPLPENEILTLLATGSTSSQLESTDAAFTKFIQLMLEEARRGRLRYGKQLQPVLEVLKDVDFRIGEVDPYTGRDFGSVTVPLTDRWLTSISFDDEGRNRAVIIYVTRFK
jgi:hypothetical protein